MKGCVKRYIIVRMTYNHISLPLKAESSWKNTWLRCIFCVLICQRIFIFFFFFFTYPWSHFLFCVLFFAQPIGPSTAAGASAWTNGRERRVRNLRAGMLIFSSQRGSSLFITAEVAEYSARCRCSWIMSVAKPLAGAGVGVGGRQRGEESGWVVAGGARWITRRRDLTGGVELCDHSKVLIISLTFSISPVIKENRWLHPGLCSPRNDSSKGAELPRKKWTLNERRIGPDRAIRRDTDSVAKQT